MGRGGYREGAGRPKGAPKARITVPEQLLPDIEKLLNGEGYACPLYATSVQAGFPSPADDYIERKLDLNEHLIQHPAATFFVRASGQSMIGAGISDGDLLVVDRSLSVSNGKIVIAALNGELTVKRYQKKSDGVWLLPENPEYTPIHITSDIDALIWGVVTNIIKKAT